MKNQIKRILYYILYPLDLIHRVKVYKKRKKCNLNLKEFRSEEFVSIVIVTYNAKDYVEQVINSLKKTSYKNFEIIVVDNNSNEDVKKYLKKMKQTKQIDKLFLSESNTYFAGGNNIGATLCSEKSKYILLLNSDVEIKHPDWLKILLLNAPHEGIVSFGTVFFPSIRPDGYCLLINRSIYNDVGGISSKFPMNGSITDLAAKVYNHGYTLNAIYNHDKYVVHFGQKSYKKKSKPTFYNPGTRTLSKVFNRANVNLLII